MKSSDPFRSKDSWNYLKISDCLHIPLNKHLILKDFCNEMQQSLHSDTGGTWKIDKLFTRWLLHESFEEVIQFYEVESTWVCTVSNVQNVYQNTTTFLYISAPYVLLPTSVRITSTFISLWLWYGAGLIEFTTFSSITWIILQPFLSRKVFALNMQR